MFKQSGVFVLSGFLLYGCGKRPAAVGQDGQAAPAPAAMNQEPAAEIATASGLKILDRAVGQGAEAKSGNRVTVHYTGTLTDGKKFDSSLDRSEPFVFNLGAGQVIKGWDEGVAGMKVGGKRRLHIPSALAYGERGAGGAIPPNADLVFEIELLKVE